MEESKKPKTTQEVAERTPSKFPWWQDEVYMNRHMNIIGQNGNDGIHYFWEDSWNEEYED